MRLSVCFALFASLALSALPLRAEGEDEKLSVDPTKVITKIGLRYTNTLTVAGSVALGPVNKINASYSESGEWSFGASHLFRFGIVNIAASRRELSGGNTQTQYSIGSFVPLKAFGIEPAGWQLFPTFGYNYAESTIEVFDLDLNEYISVPVSSDTGYIGILALRPINEKWIFMGGAFGAKGSNDYSGFSLGAGLTYNVTDRDSITVFGSYIDNSFGTREVTGIGYKREF